VTGEVAQGRGVATTAALNYAALAFAAGAALAANAIIAWFYSVEALGVFNQVYAVYVVASQFAASGIHLGVLAVSNASQTDAARREAGTEEVLPSAIAAVALTGGATMLLLIAAAEWASQLLESPQVAAGLRTVAIALPLFAANKCFQARFTALGQMRTVAGLQTIRAVALLAAIFGCAVLDFESTLLPAAFVVAEVAVLTAALLALERIIGPLGSISQDRLAKLFRFGAGSLVGSALQELNVRIDILVIGLLLDDAAVGIYSFAGLVAEGMLSALAVIRNMLVPRLSAVLKDPARTGLAGLVANVWSWTYPGAALAGLAALLSLWVGLRALYGSDSVYRDSVPLLAILLAGIVLVAGIIVFDFVFVVGDRPGLHSLMIAISASLNVALNFALIPLLGLAGAAIATAIATVALGMTIVALAWFALGACLLPVRTR